jgi:hypothetical protein
LHTTTNRADSALIKWYLKIYAVNVIWRHRQQTTFVINIRQNLKSARLLVVCIRSFNWLVAFSDRYKTEDGDQLQKLWHFVQASRLHLNMSFCFRTRAREGAATKEETADWHTCCYSRATSPA